MTSSNSKVGLAAAIACGYVLGRTKKGRLALTVVSFIAGRRLGADPRQLLAEGLRKLSESPQFTRLSEQVRGELTDAARSAVSAMADRQLDSISEVIHKRTEALKEGKERPKKETEETQEAGETTESREAEEAGEARAKEETEETEGTERRVEKEEPREGEEREERKQAAGRETPERGPREASRKSAGRRSEPHRSGRR